MVPGIMMHGEEVEIDLRDSEGGSTAEEEGDSQDSQDREEPLWRAPVPPDDEDNTDDTCNLVEISDTRPLISARDPRGINECLRVRVATSVLPAVLRLSGLTLDCGRAQIRATVGISLSFASLFACFDHICCWHL